MTDLKNNIVFMSLIEMSANYSAIFREIDLSELPSSRERNYETGVALFYGVEVVFPILTPKRFLIRPLAATLGVTRGLLLSKFFNHHDYERVFSILGIHEEDEISKEETGARTLSTRLLWCAIRWLNREVFIEIASKAFIHIDIYKQHVPFTDIDGNQIKVFGVNVICDKRDGLIYFQDLNRVFSQSQELKTRELTKYKRAGTIRSLIEIFKQKASFSSIIDEKRVLSHAPALFIHPNLSVYFMDYLYTMDFWNASIVETREESGPINVAKESVIEETLINNSEAEPILEEKHLIEETLINNSEAEPILEEKHLIEETKRVIRPSIDLNETKTLDIDDNFGYGRIAEFNLRFHKGTSYIHAASTAEAIYGDTEKMKHFADRFLGNADTKEFIKELAQEIRENTKFNDSNPIEAQLIEHPAWFKLPYTGNKDLQGYFLHPELWLQFVFWLNKKIGMRLNQILAIRLQRAAVKEQTIDELPRIEREKLTKEIAELKEENAKLKHQLRIIEIAETGSIIIEGNSNGFHTRTSPINEPIKTNRIVIENVRKPKMILDAIQEALSSKFTRIRKNLWEGELNDETRQVIEKAINDYKVREAQTAFVFNEKEYESRLDAYQRTGNQFDRGFLYECVCSRELKAALYKDVSDEWLSHFGLTHDDPGIDLIDIENKHLYQCKCYSILKNSNAIQRSAATYAKVKAIDSEYTITLLVPTKCYVHKPVRAIFDNVQKIDFQ